MYGDFPTGGLNVVLASLQELQPFSVLKAGRHLQLKDVFHMRFNRYELLLLEFTQVVPPIENLSAVDIVGLTGALVTSRSKHICLKWGHRVGVLDVVPWVVEVFGVRCVVARNQRVFVLSQRKLLFHFNL